MSKSFLVDSIIGRNSSKDFSVFSERVTRPMLPYPPSYINNYLFLSLAQQQQLAAQSSQFFNPHNLPTPVRPVPRLPTFQPDAAVLTTSSGTSSRRSSPMPGNPQVLPIPETREPSPGPPSPQRPCNDSSSKRIRTAFTGEQLLYLESVFQHTKYITRIKRIEISAKLGLAEKQVKIWFQNRRVKYKKEEASDEETNNTLHGKCRCMRSIRRKMNCSTSSAEESDADVDVCDQ